MSRPEWGVSAEPAVSSATRDGDRWSLRVDGVELGTATATLDDGVATLRWSVARASRPAAAALREVVDAAFASGARRVEARVASRSRADQQLAMRAGLRREGVLRRGADDGDVTVFACVAEDPAPSSPGGFTGVLDSTLPTKRLIAHVVMTDHDGRILLCETTFKRDWELPGGVVEPGESPARGAAREVKEEIGVDLPIGRLLAVDWLPPYLGWSDATELLYDGGRHDPAYLEDLVLDAVEIASVRWCSLAEAVERVSPLNARRLPLLLPHPPTDLLHLEDGRPT